MTDFLVLRTWNGTFGGSRTVVTLPQGKVISDTQYPVNELLASGLRATVNTSALQALLLQDDKGDHSVIAAAVDDLINNPTSGDLSGYVLVEMELTDDTWHLVKETPRVMGFIGGKADQPAPLTDAEAQAILDRVAEGSEKATPKTVFEPGELVRVIDGPFNDFNGVVEEVNYDKNRLHVGVTIFGRSTPVELDFDQVEKG